MLQDRYVLRQVERVTCLIDAQFVQFVEDAGLLRYAMGSAGDWDELRRAGGMLGHCYLLWLVVGPPL